MPDSGPDTGLKLPADLVAFLQSGASLEYDHEQYDPGKITLLTLPQLKLQNFPVDYDTGLDDSHEDPHAGEAGCYLVQGVNRVATCEDFDPEGIILWLPVEQRFGAWDSDHRYLEMFGETVTWTSIVADPGPHLEASCGGEGYDPPFSRLQPWHKHPYSASNVEGLQEIE